MKATARTLSVLIPWTGLALAIAALLLTVWRWSEARRDAAALRNWQTAILRQVSAASGTGETLRPADAAAAIDTIIAGRDAAKAMAAATSAPNVPPPMATADGSSGEISRLRRTHSTGSAAGDARIIEVDSQAAWSGWNK